MYEFWYDYVKPKYVKNANACYMACYMQIITIQRFSQKKY